MKLRQRIAMILTLALVCMAWPAGAVPVNLGEQPMIVPTVSIADSTAVDLILREFQLLGTDANGDYLIYANQSYYSVSQSNMGAILSALSLNPAGLPNIAGFQSLSRGSKGAAVEALQTALSALGYLNGPIDGDFGGGTEGALVAFQAAVGENQNGIASPMQQMLAMSMANLTQPASAPQADGQPLETIPLAQPGNEIPLADPGQTPSTQAQYAAIADRTEANMQPIYDSGLTFEYDDMIGKGFISDGTVMSYDLSEGVDIGKYQLTVQFGLLTLDKEDGTVSIDPAVRVTCLCIQRPVMNEVIVKSGEKRGTNAIEDLSSTLQGISSVETGIAILDDQAVNALIDAAENGELKLRINGRYKSFDVQVGDEFIAYASRIGMIAQQIRK